MKRPDFSVYSRVSPRRMKNKCLRFITLIPLCSAFLPVLAQRVSEDAAVSVALRYFGRHAAASGPRSAGSVTAAGVTPWTAGDTTTMYAVRMTGGGWVLVAADARVTPVLAYSESGRFSADSMPDGMRWLFGLYSEEIRYAMDSLPEGSSEDEGEPVFHDKGLNAGGSAYYDPGNALLNTVQGEIQWNQDAAFRMGGQSVDCGKAYNYYCPESDEGPCGRCPAGCGAVALAQIMRYWKWPLKAEVPTRISKNGGITSGEETHYYDWNGMPVQVRVTSAEDSARAVAGLLRDVGYAAHTDYEGDGSGTDARDLVSALETFAYHTDDYDVIHGSCGDLLRAEINQGRPVVYGASRDGGGHWFIVDGYSDTDPKSFHINWGWGRQNSFACYCRLDSIRPKSNAAFYDRNVRIITGIYPECSSVKSMNLGGNAIDTEFLHISCPFIESANQLKGRKYIFEVDEMVLRPGFSVEKGTELQIITPSYQYCNHYGPGKKN